MSYNLRKATINDARFLSKVIVEAEKSGSDKVGLATIFDLTESELQSCLIQMLEEEISGCEFSLSSYVVAEYNNEPVAAFGGWIEGENEDEQSSAILKSNLLGFFLPKEKLIRSREKQHILKNILFDRTPHTLQFEYAYVDKDHRGQGLTYRIIEELQKIAKKQNPRINKSQVQVFENNISAIKVYERSGFKIVTRYESSHTEVLNYLPWNVKLLMEKQI